ncbi:MAG: 30S ribosomal protein S12 methylthiotransferase RimO [Candidatus Sericytochromatia bacterium]|nr:30S ribosomal protein S12 methylthiotransferase RimO [Candidatus Sericytochromatia bacterium]
MTATAIPVALTDAVTDKVFVPTRVGVVHLGCAKNLVDTESMLGLVAQAGHEVVTDETTADVVIINTCGFLASAQKEAIETILEVGQWGKKIIVAGCLIERHKEELVAELPEVQGFIGTGEYAKIVEVLEGVLDGQRVTRMDSSDYMYQGDTPRFRTSLVPYTYLKISEGCDHPCTFCIIPQLRGKMRSRTIESIVKEAKELIGEGYKEIVLIGQDTTAYGTDLPTRTNTATLLRTLGQLDAKFRLMYAYPTTITNELLDVMATEPNIIPYLDMPLQHSHPEVLKNMKRPYGAGYNQKLIARIREKLPTAVLRTTFIAGFPGETDEQFEDLLSFIRETEFDHVGVFAYSKEDTATSFHHTGHLTQKVKKDRVRAAMQVQQQVLRQTMPRHIGKTYAMLVEGVQAGKVFGRTFLDAPEVDGLTYAKGHANPGDWIDVKITKAGVYDTFGEVVGEST